MSDTLKPDYERIAKELSAEQGEHITAEYLEALDNRTESEWLNKFGEAADTSLAGTVAASPSPFFGTHPVVKILKHNQETPMTHVEHSKKAGLAVPCSALHITFGGRCLNCGYDPTPAAPSFEAGYTGSLEEELRNEFLGGE
jgi:hypothetical protein